jgi:hypothetical protein
MIRLAKISPFALGRWDAFQGFLYRDDDALFPRILGYRLGTLFPTEGPCVPEMLQVLDTLVSRRPWYSQHCIALITGAPA